jgi:hypothetical protein
MQEIIRILLLSDIHYIHPKNRVPIDDVKWVLRIAESLSDFARWFWFKTTIAEKLKNAWYKVNRRYIYKALYRIKLDGPYDEAVVLGDQINGYQDQGMVTPLAKKEGRVIRNIIKKLFGHMIALSGGHDAGWILASGAWGSIGITRESLDAYQQIYGEMHGARKLCFGLTLIWLSSEPFMVRKRWNKYFRQKQLDWLRQKRQIELAFLENALRELDGKFILAVHDSGALLCPELQNIINRYQYRLLVTLCGHFHARWTANIYYWLNFANRKFRFASWRYRVQIVPSLWGIVISTPLGFWHPGAGWAELLINLTSKKASLYIHYLSQRKTKKIDLGSIN